ncbi:MAG TPA: NADH-quinone oxidoreductase subunit N [Gemmatimonadales bacterium]
MTRLFALLPEITLLVGGLAIFTALMADPGGSRGARNTARVVALLLVVACLESFRAESTMLWGSYRVDRFSQLIKLAVAAGFALSVFIARSGEGQRDDARGELFFFLLTSTAGLMMMASAVEAVALYLSLEIASYSLFVLVPLRERFAKGKEAGLKFVVVGLASSAVTLYGLSLLIGITGSTRLAAIAVAPALVGGAPLAIFALGLFAAGFLFKLAFFPFHFWAPDVYEGSSNGVAAFVATASKVAALAIVARLLVIAGLNSRSLAIALAAAASIAMTLGNLVAIVQRDLKRMLAWSAVAQAGYLAVGLIAFTSQGIASALFYGLIYLLMNAGAFLVVARVASDGSNVSLDDLRGLHARAPLLAATLLLSLFALAGVPPTAGFIGKWLLFRAAMAQGWWWLVLLGAINSTISVYYYLIVVKHAYLLPADQAPQPVRLTLGDHAVCLGLCGALLILGLYPTPVFDWAAGAAEALLR